MNAIKKQKERSKKQEQRSEYITRNIVRETEKAYLVEQTVHGGYGARTNYKWVAKSACKNRRTVPVPYTNLISDTVEVPVWCV